MSTELQRVDSYLSEQVVSHRLQVYHYATKSLADFQEKMRRGGGLGVHFRDMRYWSRVQSMSTEKCTAASDAWRRMQRQRRKRAKTPP